jgi:hypothetical protein
MTAVRARILDVYDLSKRLVQYIVGGGDFSHNANDFMGNAEAVLSEGQARKFLKKCAAKAHLQWKPSAYNYKFDEQVVPLKMYMVTLTIDGQPVISRSFTQITTINDLQEIMVHLPTEDTVD